jgi:predicted amidohydrolase YtcJ
VPIALGSDGISGEVPFVTAKVEALFLYDQGFADSRTLLKQWCETSPATIFPSRKLGRLEPGYEASFLVLDGDPIADFHNVTRIRSRVKQGSPIVLAAH